MGALQTYITATQRLLHDATYRFWSATELTDYVNQARTQTALDSKCLSQIVTNVQLTSTVELYSMQGAAIVAQVPAGYIPVDVMGISVYNGNMRIKLRKYPWQKFDAWLRYSTNFAGLPFAFTRKGGNSIYIGPVPNQNYLSDWDIALAPPPLVNDADLEPIPVPFQDPVAFFAAHRAKFQSQDLGEADKFEAYYKRRLSTAGRQFNTWSVPNPYGTTRQL